MSSIAEKLFFNTVKSDFKEYKTYFNEDELFEIYEKISFVTDFGTDLHFLYVINELRKFPLEEKISFWEKLNKKIRKELSIK